MAASLTVAQRKFITYNNVAVTLLTLTNTGTEATSRTVSVGSPVATVASNDELTGSVNALYDVTVMTRRLSALVPPPRGILHHHHNFVRRLGGIKINLVGDRGASPAMPPAGQGQSRLGGKREQERGERERLERKRPSSPLLYYPRRCDHRNAEATFDFLSSFHPGKAGLQIRRERNRILRTLRGIEAQHAPEQMPHDFRQPAQFFSTPMRRFFPGNGRRLRWRGSSEEEPHRAPKRVNR